MSPAVGLRRPGLRGALSTLEPESEPESESESEPEPEPGPEPEPVALLSVDCQSMTRCQVWAG